MRYASKRKTSTRRAKLIASLMLPAMLAGCASWATSGPATDGGTFCQIAEPICLSKQDKLSEGSLYRIVKHNERGRALQCWDYCQKDQ